MKPSPMRQADIAFSKWIRERDGKCQAAGEPRECKGFLQCAHIIGRGEHAIRCDPDNAITLCQAHHKYYTVKPADWREFIDRAYPGRWDELWQRIQTHRAEHRRIDWSAIAEEFA